MQCLPLESVKNFFTRDVLHDKGCMTASILEMANTDQCQRTTVLLKNLRAANNPNLPCISALELRDSAVECFTYRIECVVKDRVTSPSGSVKYLVEQSVPVHLIKSLEHSNLDTHRNWYVHRLSSDRPPIHSILLYRWTEHDATYNSAKELDYLTLGQRVISICLLSSFSTQPVSNSIRYV
jgi:hypothetical protein